MLGTIRWKIILYSVVPVTLLYNLIFCIYFYMTYEDITGEIEARMQNEVVGFCRAVDSEIKHIMHLARMESGKYNRANRVEIEAILDPVSGSELLQNPIISSVVFYELNPGNSEIKGHGFFLKKGESLQWKGLLESNNLIAQILKKTSKTDAKEKELWTPLYKDALTGIQVISYLIPVYFHNKFAGYLSFDLSVQQLMTIVLDRDSFIGRYEQIKLWKFNLVDRQGNYIYTEDNKAIRYGHGNLIETGQAYRISGFGNNIGELIDLGRPSSDVVIAASGFPREYWFFGAPVKTTGWWFYTYISRDKALSSGYAAIVSNAVILAVSLILITICSWYASLKITQPVLALKKAMDVFTYKNTMPVFSVNSSDEIGSLAESFQQLLEKLADRDQALHDARANNIGHLVQKLGGTYFYFNLDRDGCITHVSPSIEAILGFKPGEFLRSFLCFISSSRDRSRFDNQLKNILSGGWSEPFELDLRHKNGGCRRLEIFWSDMGRSGGEFCAIEGMANDITERVSDAEKFKGLLDSGPDATVIATTEGVISLVNSRAEELFGYRRSELVNMPLHLLTPEEHRIKHPLLGELRKASWDQLCLSGFESRGINSAGRIFPIEVTSSPLETDEGLLISIVARDITERKRIESELRSAKEQAEQASMAKGMFLSNMSHELRTPLNGVLGYTQILLRDGDMPVRHRKSLRAIESSGYHLLSLINDILDLTKIESGEIELHLQPSYLRQMLHDVKSMIVERAVSKGLELKLNVPDFLPEVVVLDEIKTRQVLLNLLSNAVKYTGSGWVTLDIIVQDKRLFFSIKDSGVGIDCEDIELVFEPFRQLQPGLEAGGTGLGLAISRWLVACMGGSLSVRSTKGKGSEFIFDIPLKVSEDSVASKSISKLSGLQELNIDTTNAPIVLVVDDIESNRDMMCSLLEGAGFRTEKACNGLEAINNAISQCYDLILMDIKMPVLNGVEAVRKMRNMNETRKMTIVAVTASVSIQARRQLLREGFDGYVGKPFDANELFKLIGQLLNIPVSEKTDRPLYETVELMGALKADQRQKIGAILSEALEIGDLEWLEEKLKQSLGSDSAEGFVVELLVALCHDMNLERLEELARELNDSTDYVA